MRIEGVQTSGLVVTSLGLIVLTGIEEVVVAIVTLVVLAGEQKVVMHDWIWMNEKLLSVGTGLDEGAPDMHPVSYTHLTLPTNREV